MVTRTYDDIHREFDEKEQQNLSFINRRMLVDLPVYPGPKADHQMVAGADIFLNKISGPPAKCALNVSDRNCESAEALKLGKGYNPENGGYILKSYPNTQKL